MLKITQYQDLDKIMMGSTINGQLLYTVFAFFLDGLLIDTGCHNTRYELIDYLGSKELSKVVNTHHHIDHIGANQAIMDKFKVPIFAHPEALPFIADGFHVFSYQKELWGAPTFCRVKPLGKKITTKRFDFEVIHTGGHSKGHVVLFLKNRGWLFTGDEFLTNKPNSSSRFTDNHQMIKALQKMMNFESELLITCSGGIFKKGKKILSRTIDYYRETESNVLSLTRQGLTPAEIVLKLFNGETPLYEYTNGEFSRQNFVEGFLKKSSLENC